MTILEIKRVSEKQLLVTTASEYFRNEYVKKFRAMIILGYRFKKKGKEQFVVKAKPKKIDKFQKGLRKNV